MTATPDVLTETPGVCEFAHMDALSDVLRVVRLVGSVFLDARFSAPWSLTGRVEGADFESFLDQVAPAQVIGFHYVVSGRLLAHVEGGDPVELRAGEIVLLPRNDVHILASGLDIKPMRAADVVLPPAGAGIPQVTYGGGGEETHIVCGYLAGDAQQSPVIASLPPLITLNVKETPGGEWIEQSFAFAARELAGGSVGGATVISKLSELMFVEAVRRYVATLPPESTGWLAGLRDPAISKALALMHTQVARAWTAEDLADAVNLSRSAFAERFTTLIGQPPMKYLTNWRMQIATHRLREGRLSIGQIAFDIGYESEAAFTRAFKREIGAPPAAWRKRATET
jgi:AraC-like DNA-binding protein